MRHPQSSVRLFRALIVASCKLAFSGVLLATAPQTSTAQQSAVATAPIAIRSNALRAHVEFLADDLLEGRGAGTRGHALAAAYVASQFKSVGLKGAGDEQSYLQAVPLLEATVVLPGAAAKLVRDGETTSFEYSTDFLPGPDYTAPTSTLSAPLTFVGFGVHAPELNHDDFAHVDVRDRVVVVISGAPKRFSANQRAYYSSASAKYAEFVKRGAVGVITFDLPEDAERTPWDKRVAMSWQPQMRWTDAEGEPADAYPEIKQRFRFKSEAVAKFFAGAERSLEQVFAAAVQGEAQGFALPGTITMSSTTGLRRTESFNVLGFLEGRDPLLKHEVIVVTGHLDHLGRGAAVNGDVIYNGAHDNASGIAILLELAHALSREDVPLRRSILFAAVTAEEKGLLGSDFLAHQLAMQRRVVVANLNIDMPLLLAKTRDLVAFGAEHSSLGPIARRAAQSQGYVLSRDREPEQVRFIRSDQFSFVRRGIPAINLISGGRAVDKAVDVRALQAEFRKKHYHQPSDDLSLPVSYDAAVGLARVNASILIEVANAPTAPFYYRDDFFQKKFGRR